ncbi:DUF1970 domain-containing protein [Halorubrum sp. JWXQ-INN 858]|uniref:sugar transferase n=1 Tax=Halorubrum sp. JWXQ-INN 858 TaxID=2690782 RepID=UPI00135B74BD|nr:sugar transferase [Halorubrum sp. JWXQ-INN 858]MWV65228.1 DUF1970 domain-containing protein [Halorubrum sp. JWXQ-INN 858]
MLSGWRYRLLSVFGVAALAAAATLIANHPVPQSLFTTYVPLFDRLDPIVLSGDRLFLVVGLSLLAIVGSLIPLYKPRPRRMLDVVLLAQKRVLVAGLAIATLGFFKWSLRVPRATLTITIGLLLLLVPAWFVGIRRQPRTEPSRAIIVGDDAEQIRRLAAETSFSFLGYLAPSAVFARTERERIAAVADGGAPEIDRLGGLSRIEDLLVGHDVDTVVLAFSEPDRAEFFGTLDACYEHGVAAKVHRAFADSVLTAGSGEGPLVDVEVEPWDVQDYFFKRVFDVAFAIVGLVVFAPVMVAIAVAITLDDRGPVLYQQERTAGLGETITVAKFRSMTPKGASATPSADADNDRITRVGRVLRRTHLDELPQLWTILKGDMSVVGPRAAWTEEETLLERETDSWRKRWFVKPGLTGLAQVNDVKSTEPRKKLRYDLEYIRRQSFWYDLKIVIRQIWAVVSDLRTVLDTP